MNKSFKEIMLKIFGVIGLLLIIGIEVSNLIDSVDKLHKLMKNS